MRASLSPSDRPHPVMKRTQQNMSAANLDIGGSFISPVLQAEEHFFVDSPTRPAQYACVGLH
jgi:hypothetical protein